MRFGLQKLTLLDYPGAVACTAFSCGCNFRCPFCHNGALVTGSETALELDFSSLLEFLEKRTGILDAVCFTGGEFLLHPEAPEAAAAAKALGYKVKIDTNGSCPEALEKIIASGDVDMVAMDIKNSQAKYPETCRWSSDLLDKVCTSVELLKKAPVSYEFRTTVTGVFHELSDFEEIGRWIAGAPAYFLQPFAPSDDLLDPGRDYAVSDRFLREALETVRPYVPSAEIRGR